MFQSYESEKLSLKNRIVMAPMCMYEVEKEDGIVTPFHFTHYGARALGGVGLIIVEASAVTKEGRITKNDVGIWNDDQIPNLKELVEHVHDLGSKIGIQLAHAGRKAQDEPVSYAPSAIAFSEEYQTPQKLNYDEIKETVQKFKKAAERAEKANFDMVEIHAAHGYLLNQFLSPVTNKRDDGYGQNSLADRFCLLKEVVEEVKQSFSKSVWVRISGTDYVENSTTEEEFRQIVAWLKELGIDVLHVSSGGLCNVKPTKVYPGYQTKWATLFKKEIGIPVATVGKLGDPQLASFIIEDEQADFLALGRPLLRNPNWVNEAAIVLNEKSYEPYNHSYKRGMIE
ncbi:NADH:flavin oxidoreductase/NADH oxidase [Lacticigenium naphthae]|uniref:NADH:flavin oxidoreductase/NADH oxidase n=1 Tax=Lacticigenium naphthae TaxID=515351 RepID=UPI000484007E|nr:NADH:flavin oxidoreductase/NADH oxidase [Lacticigenium naphthae]